MKLYYSKGACSLAIRITLNEIGAAYQTVAVNLKTKQTETDENYLAINPKGAVPALRLDTNEILTENAVIHQYLADTFKATHLLPPVPDLNRYRVLEWLNFVSTDLHKSFSPLFNPNMPDAAQEIFRKTISNKFKFVNDQLTNKTFLMGKQFTVADSYLFVMLVWAYKLNIDISAYSELAAYFARLKQRASVKKALQDEGLSI